MAEDRAKGKRDDDRIERDEETIKRFLRGGFRGSLGGQLLTDDEHMAVCAHIEYLAKQLALYREYVVADMEVTKHIPETPTHTKSGGYRDSEHRRAHSVAWTRKHAAMAALPEDKTDG